MWDTRTGERVAVLAGGRGAIDGFAREPDGARLVTADRVGHDFPFPLDGPPRLRSLRVWDLVTGQPIRRVDVDLRQVGGTDWRVHWLAPGRVLVQLDARQNPARASSSTRLAYLDPTRGTIGPWSESIDGEQLTLSPDLRRATASLEYGVYRTADGRVGRGGRGTAFRVQLVDMERLRVIATLDAPPVDVDGPGGFGRASVVLQAWSPDGRRVATVRGDHSVRVWNADTGRLVSAAVGHTDWVLGAAFSPDGRVLATASEDRTARLWDAATGRQIHALAGHDTGLNDVAFDPDGARVATVAEDGRVCLWDVTTGRQVRVWDPKAGPLRQVAFQAGLGRVWARAADGAEWVWSMADGAVASHSRPADSARAGLLYLKADPDQPVELWSGPPGVPGESQPPP
ncbi:MAG TPA: WD40 repeat domain-containing protein [Humisphaera sp.]